MPKDEEQAFVLTKGSKYRVISAESKEKSMKTVGIFRGYTSIGPDEAIVMELDRPHEGGSSKLRVIPLHMILAIDVLEAVEEEEKEREPEKMYL